MYILYNEAELIFVTLLTLPLRRKGQHVQVDTLRDFLPHVSLALMYVAFSALLSK